MRGGATIVGAGADVVILPTLPVPAQLMFAVRYVGDPDELDGETEHPIACRVFAPGGSQMGEQTASLKASAIPIVPGYVAEMTIPTALVLEMREYGTHRIEFSIDGNSVDVPMHCIKELP